MPSNKFNVILCWAEKKAVDIQQSMPEGTLKCTLYAVTDVLTNKLLKDSSDVKRHIMCECAAAAYIFAPELWIFLWTCCDLVWWHNKESTIKSICNELLAYKLFLKEFLIQHKWRQTYEIREHTHSNILFSRAIKAKLNCSLKNWLIP